MSMSMRSTRHSGWQSRLPDYAVRDTGLIRGVCAQIAERAGVPAWMPRAAFLMFGVVHWLLAVIAYVILAKLLCGGRTRAAGVPPDAFESAPPSGAVRDRFTALDARLADLGRASLQESDLRRAFRDLERR